MYLYTNPNQGIFPANNPPIGIAALCGRLEAVKLLLRCPNVDISFRNKFGSTLVEVAEGDIHENDKKAAAANGFPFGSDYEIRQRKREIVNAIRSRSALLRQGHTCPE